MRRLLTNALATVVAAASLTGSLWSQATPTATDSVYNPGPVLPVLSDKFKYSLTATETVQRGDLQSYESTFGSGTLEYQNLSPVTPFSVLYSGGIGYSNLANIGVETFHDLTVTQGLVANRWNLGISDSVSYLPNAPVGDLTGVVGLGNQGILPPTNPNAPGQTVLSLYGTRVSNSVSGDIQRRITERLTLDGNANYGILRYLDGNGYDNDQIGSMVGATYELSPRTKIGANAQYGIYTYPGTTNFQTKGLNGTWSREMSRSLALSFSGGPQWVSSYTALTFGAPTLTAVQVPATINFATSASLSFSHRYTQAAVTYSRGVNNGSGVQSGGLSNSVMGSVAESFGRDWSASLSANYNTLAGLGVLGSTTNIFSTLQVSRRLGRDVFVYSSASVEHQQLNSALSTTYLLNGTGETFAIGITYSPNSQHPGQF
ncbi:MAG: hypothetical protein KGK08_09595 [Acidobacteriota bacterium]|nr:hypothetical protein [Acidobacteriota bacterium]